jgi:hypothetical protein
MISFVSFQLNSGNNSPHIRQNIVKFGELGAKCSLSQIPKQTESETEQFSLDCLSQRETAASQSGRLARLSQPEWQIAARCATLQLVAEIWQKLQLVARRCATLQLVAEIW